MLTLNELKIENKQLKLKIKQLQHQVDEFESLQRCKCCDCCEESVQDYADLLLKYENFKSKVKEMLE